MKLLLTSAGISNPGILKALEGLLNKRVQDSTALFIPTAIYGVQGGMEILKGVIDGSIGDPFCNLGWKSVGILELSTLPSISKDYWLPRIEKADALLVGGGDCQYLTYWMNKSGLAALLPDLLEKVVYVGLSAGSMIMTRYGTTFSLHNLSASSPKSLGILDFAIHPHLDHEWFPENSMGNLEKLAGSLPFESYLIDDQTAIKVENDLIEVISEGNWKKII